MTTYIRADGKNKPRFDFRGYPRGLPQRLLIFSRVLTPLDRTDWIYAFSSDQYLTEPERLTGLNVINHLNLETQACHPDQQTLGFRIGRTHRTIAERLRFIRRAGWLTVHAQSNTAPKRAGRRANEYVPTLPAALLEAIRGAFPELNKVKSELPINTPELKEAWTSHNSHQLQEGRIPNYRKSGLPPFREGIGNKKERESFEEVTVPGRDFFVEVDSPEWEAWCKLKRWPQNDFKINGSLKRGWWFPSEWPSSEIKSNANGFCAAALNR